MRHILVPADVARRRESCADLVRSEAIPSDNQKSQGKRSAQSLGLSLEAGGQIRWQKSQESGCVDAVSKLQV